MTKHRQSDDEVITQADLLKLLRVSGDAVLVGGQALAFWVFYFNLDLPDGPRPYVSTDADFLGFRSHVEAFSHAIGGRAEYPTRRQITALHGVVMKQTRSGEQIGVDVLHAVVGVGADEVREHALDVRHPQDPNVSFRVMSPIDCMVSRFENLRKLADKHSDVGVWQARISIAVCRAHLEKLLALEDERQAIRAATRLLEIAGTAPGLQAFRKHDLNLLDGIPIARFKSRTFKEQQYKRTVARIKILREAYRPPPRPTER